MGRDVLRVRGPAQEDWYLYTLKLTEALDAWLAHVALQVSTPELLQIGAEKIERRGLGLGWSEGDLGPGTSFRFRVPDGYQMEVVWELGYCQALEEQHSPLRNRSSADRHAVSPSCGSTTLTASCARWSRMRRSSARRFKLRETKIGGDRLKVGSWLSVSPLVHEIAVMRDGTGQGERLHHVAYWHGYPQHLYDVAELCMDWGVRIEAGPGKHGTTLAFFLYLFEPGATASSCLATRDT